MMYAIVYRAVDGAIVATRSYEDGHPGNAVALPTGCSQVIAAAAPTITDEYIAGSPPTVTARPASPCTIDKTSIVANGTDTATISSIPVGTTALVTDANGTVAYTVNDGTLEITADEPGQIAVTVAAPFPAKALTVTVTAA